MKLARAVAMWIIWNIPCGRLAPRLIAFALGSERRRKEKLIYTKSDAEAMCAIAVAGARHLLTPVNTRQSRQALILNYSGLSPSKDELWRENDSDRRQAAIARELALVVPIFTLRREGNAQLRKLAKMIHEPQLAESATELDAYDDQEFEIIKNAITRSHGG